MKLNELTKITARSKKRLGQGLGSGKGKTGGRGSKGQKARSKVAPGFIGGALPLYRKLPYQRGFHRDGVHKSTSLPSKMKPINLEDLNFLNPKAEVTLQTLLEAKLITKQDAKKGVKILGNGEITKELIVKLPVSSSAKQKIEKAGGSVEEHA